MSFEKLFSEEPLSLTRAPNSAALVKRRVDLANLRFQGCDAP